MQKVKELPARLIASFILSGLTYAQYEEVLHVMDLKLCSKETWSHILNCINTAAKELLNNYLSKNITACEDIPLLLSFDGAWSHRGWNANECVVAIFDHFTGSLLGIEVVIRKLPGDSYGNYEGASSQMEGEGLRRICTKLKKQDLVVHGIVHDGDGTGLKIVQQYWPEAIEFNDPGHAAKNFRKAIIKLGQKFNGAKKLGEVCLRSFRWSIIHCEGSAKDFVKLMWQQYDHICNISHNHCTHEKDYKPKAWKWVVDSETREALKKEFDAVVQYAEVYSKNYSSNVCEAFANCRTKFTDKRKNMRIMFKLGAIFTALSYCDRREGHSNWKKVILENSGFAVSSKMVSNLEKEMQLTQKEVHRYVKNIILL